MGPSGRRLALDYDASPASKSGASARMIRPGYGCNDMSPFLIIMGILSKPQKSLTSRICLPQLVGTYHQGTCSCLILCWAGGGVFLILVSGGVLQLAMVRHYFVGASQ